VSPKRLGIHTRAYIGVPSDARNHIAQSVLSGMVDEFVTLSHSRHFGDVLNISKVRARQAFLSGYLLNMGGGTAQRRETGAGASGQ
jgi:hypothetical protein